MHIVCRLFAVAALLAATFLLFRASTVPRQRPRYLRAPDAFNARRTCWSNGSWVYEPTRKPLILAHYGDVGHNGHSCEVAPEARHASLKWVWRPHDESCALHDPTPEAFCLLLGSKNILIVGDSLNYQLFETVVDFLGPQSPQSRSQFLEPESWVCNRTLRVKFVRNDILSTATAEEIGTTGLDRANNFFEASWISYVLSESWPVVVMNRGAHYVADLLLRQELRDTTAFLGHNMKRGVLIYRNTASGHKCSRSLVAPEAGHGDNVHHWAEFSRQNDISERFFSRLGAYLMDVHSLMLDRPDWHLDPPRDCLHYCIPGPVDSWMVLLYNTLRFIGPEQLRDI